MYPVQKRYLGVVIVVALGTIVYLSYLSHRESLPDLMFVNVTREKTVLFWNSFHKYADWGLGAPVRRLRCQEVECVFTNESGLLDSVDMFDAVVFHAYDSSRSRPPARGSHQSYVFALLESPANTRHQLSRQWDMCYNMTMTYRLDSDVLWAYSYVWDVWTGAIVAPAPQPLWKIVAYDEFVPSAELQTQLTAKTKAVAWFVSNCQTFSKREQLVKELQKYVQIDIFGKCGSLSCLYGSSDCHQKLDTEYKFYLSFENSLCLDYTTEKLFNALKRTVLPIVYGGSNYTRFAPPHSYVDVQDFEDVAMLGNYLQFLERNATAYATYFWWKDHYIVRAYGNGFNPAFCRLCHLLHSQATVTKVQYYPNIMEYWLSGCQEKPRIKFEWN